MKLLLGIQPSSIRTTRYAQRNWFLMISVSKHSASLSTSVSGVSDCNLILRILKDSIYGIIQAVLI